MIKLLSRYIASNIIKATAISTLLISSVLLLLNLLREIRNIGEGDYGLLNAVLFVLLRMPTLIYQFSPMLVLLGSIMGLSLLYTHREIIVMRASGYSMGKIMMSVLSAAFVIVILMSVIGEWIGPELSYRAEVHKENAQNAGQAVVTATGIWFHLDNNFIHVRRMVGRQRLEDVTRYQFDDSHHLQVAYFAKSLVYDDHQWQLVDGVKTTFYHDRTKSEPFKRATWDVVFNPNLLNVGLVEPHEMSLPKLARFSRYLQQNGLQYRAYQYDFWARILQPLAALVMVFLALPFVLGTLSAATLGWRMVIGILTGFAFYILGALVGQLCVVYQLPALFAAAMPLVLFAILGIGLCRRMIRH